jgi:hypothetical protein
MLTLTKVPKPILVPTKPNIKVALKANSITEIPIETNFGVFREEKIINLTTNQFDLINKYETR